MIYFIYKDTMDFEVETIGYIQPMDPTSILIIYFIYKDTMDFEVEPIGYIYSIYTYIYFFFAATKIIIIITTITIQIDKHKLNILTPTPPIVAYPVKSPNIFFKLSNNATNGPFCSTVDVASPLAANSANVLYSVFVKTPVIVDILPIIADPMLVVCIQDVKFLINCC